MWSRCQILSALQKRNKNDEHTGEWVCTWLRFWWEGDDDGVGAGRVETFQVSSTEKIPGHAEGRIWGGYNLWRKWAGLDVSLNLLLMKEVQGNMLKDPAIRWYFFEKWHVWSMEATCFHGWWRLSIVRIGSKFYFQILKEKSRGERERQRSMNSFVRTRKSAVKNL